MPRSRNIKPGFFTNADLVELPMHTRLLFIGLWCLADREGRLEDRVKQIKMEIFPADDVNVDASLDELASAGFIFRYQSGDRAYIAVRNFSKHQHPHHLEKASTIPAPDATRTLARHIAAPATNGQAGHGESNDVPAKRLAKRKSIEPAEGFDQFWTVYPKKLAKEEAIAAWNRIEPDVDLRAIIVAAVLRRRDSDEWMKESRKYVPYPATFLNGRRWTDEIQGPVESNEASADQEQEYLRAQGRRIKAEREATVAP